MGRGVGPLVRAEDMRKRSRAGLALAAVLLLVGGQAGRAWAQDGSGGGLLVEVRSRDGQVLRNACVTFIPREGEILFRKSDGRGRVKLTKMAPGRYRVVVKVTGFEAQKREVAVASGIETVEFLLPPRGN